MYKYYFRAQYIYALVELDLNRTSMCNAPMPELARKPTHKNV